MQPEWREFLLREGATIEGDRVVHFGDPARELTHAAQGDVLLDLSALAPVRVSGSEAGVFLGGQLTQDVRELDAAHHRIGAYCTAQGRILAILRFFRRDQEYYALLPRALRDATIERLRRYVMRAKVQIAPADALVTVGIAGPGSPTLIERVLAPAPAAPGDCVTRDDISVLRLSGEAPRFIVIGPPARMQSLWSGWRRDAQPVGAGIWDWFDIRAGLPTVLPQTVEAFVPQMVNLDLLGGISLTKGCYPGQEIVARMHYLGRLKQRMYRVHVADARAPQPGDAIHAPLMREQSAGTVVMAHASPAGGYEMLAVIQIAAVETDVAALRLHDPSGPSLTVWPLPYAFTAPSQPARD